MPAKLTYQSYGKSAVRLTKVKRLPDRHELIELEVAIELSGDFAESYACGDNSKVIATDTMKNTVYALAATHPIDAPEDFASALARHFVQAHRHVYNAIVRMWQTSWRRMTIDGREHPHSFVGAGQDRRKVMLHLTREKPYMWSGVDDLMLLKTADSAFRGFLRDAYTTLADTDDRIFATRLSADWLYDKPVPDWNAAYHAIMDAMVRVFARHQSLSVQQTLYSMGEAALEACPAIRVIHLEMPNQHRIPVNLQPLGLENRNEIFVTTTEPYGLIKATLERKLADS
jgi:urate oxidase